MDVLAETSLEFTRWLQETYPQLHGLFALVSELGRNDIYLVFMTFIYWNVDKSLGIALGLITTISNGLTIITKEALRDPRPFWLYPDIGLSEESDYGLPSGHAQTAAVFYFTIAGWLGKGWIWFLAFFPVLIIALSRIYLGVHDLEDVLTGLVIGVLLVVGLLLWRRFGAYRLNKRILGQRLMLSVSVPGVLIVAYVVMILFMGPADASVSWADFIQPAETEGVRNVTMALGGLLGLSIGFVLEGSWVRSKVEAPIWKRLVRYVLGIIPILALWFALRDAIPDDPIWLMIPLRALQVIVLSLWVSYYAPWLFVRLKLADAHPEPEIQIAL